MRGKTPEHGPSEKAATEGKHLDQPPSQSRLNIEELQETFQINLKMGLLSCFRVENLREVNEVVRLVIEPEGAVQMLEIDWEAAVSWDSSFWRFVAEWWEQDRRVVFYQRGEYPAGSAERQRRFLDLLRAKDPGFKRSSLIIGGGEFPQISSSMVGRIYGIDTINEE